MDCQCGGVVKSWETKAGWRWECAACHRSMDKPYPPDIRAAKEAQRARAKALHDTFWGDRVVADDA